jgi:hypothetical protein
MAPDPPPPKPPSPPARKGARAEREARLAAALRDNLRRRKAAPRTDGAPPGKPSGEH